MKRLTYFMLMLSIAFLCTGLSTQAETLATLVVKADSSASDRQQELQHIFDDAVKTGRPVQLEAGTFLHSGVLVLNGIEVSGTGTSTVLEGTTRDASAIILSGQGAKLSHLSLRFKATERSSTDESSLVFVHNALHFKISDLTLDGSDSAGILVLHSKDGTIESNDISNTLADSIHMTDGSSNITVHNNVTHNSGDDGIAVVSYEKNDGRVANIAVYGNQVLHNKNGRGISVVGGEDVDIHDNTVTCNTDYAGIYIASEPSYHTMAASNVKVTNNTLKGCGSVRTGHSSIMVYDGYLGTDHVLISGNTITDAPGWAIARRGKDNKAITIKDNIIIHSGEGAITPETPDGEMEISGNTIK